MNTDHIANWAINSDINIKTGEYGFICSKTLNILMEFAKHVAAYEREECAKACKKHADVYAKLEGTPATKSAWAACIDNRDAIRARGKA
jgi:hypothetical protein